jgi:chromosome segregation protein
LAAEKLAIEREKEEEKKTLKERLEKIEKELEILFTKLEAEKDRQRDLELNRRFLEGEIAREQRRKEDLENKKKEIEQKLVSLTSSKEERANLEEIPLAKELNLIFKKIQILFSLLSTLVSALGGTCPLHLVGEKEKEEAWQLKQEILMTEKKSSEQELERINFSLEAYQKELEGLLSAQKAETKSHLEEKVTELKQEKERIRQRIEELETGLSPLAFAPEPTKALEIALAKIEGEMAGLQEKMALEYHLTLEELETMPYEVSNINKAKQEVEEGKRKLRELEPVNLLAIEECEKNRERLAFIEAQLADLSAARENLQHLIAELDLRAEETFVQTIEHLSQIFSEIFSKLFIGGEARISLAPGQPPLAAEIEISVRPSGRKWLPLTMLSGGERALAAIALLFSLLKIRPSPFCFLDEVDAALDDANIGRFVEMLKTFSTTTQIIIITHNKKTMGVANNIYGITMEEPGVSKVISMKLAEVVA